MVNVCVQHFDLLLSYQRAN